MSTHVTLKVVGSSSPALQQVVRVRSGPTVNCAYEPWGCGQCASYASRDNTYRVISKDCGEHACLIPDGDYAPPVAPKIRRPRKAKPVSRAPLVVPALDLPVAELAHICERSVRYPTRVAAVQKAPRGETVHPCRRCGGFHLLPLKGS